MDDLPFANPDAAPANPAAPTPRKPRHRHRWLAGWPAGRGDLTVCVVCETVQNLEASRRGRTSLRAGKDAERAIAKAYGGTRTGQYGGPDDVVVGDLFVVQSKAGGWFSERMWAELAKLPRTGGRVPTLIVSDRPGPGKGRTRRLVIRTLDDDVALHGERA